MPLTEALHTYKHPLNHRDGLVSKYRFAHQPRPTATLVVTGRHPYQPGQDLASNSSGFPKHFIIPQRTVALAILGLPKIPCSL
jgi:hypothetical protein